MPIGIEQLTCLQTLNYFIVDKESGSGLDGLQGLNNLRGELRIKGLDGVETAMEGKEANLMSKKNLNSLELCWANWSDLRQQQNVIEGFQPHSNLKRLVIEGYGGVLSPSWLTASLVPNLVEIRFSRCAFEHLGPLRKLNRLKVLDLFKLPLLKFIEEEAVVNDVTAGGFPSLEVIRLEGMPDLEGWSSQSQSQSQSQAAAVFPLSLSSSSLSQASITQEGAAVFPCLKSVRLSDCPKLKGEIPLALSPVQRVVIDGTRCNRMVLASLQDLPSLPSLQIDGFGEMEYFPPGTLTNLNALHKLKICYCRNLKTLPHELNSLGTLTELEIWGCPKLVSLAEEREGGLKNLSSLKTLHIHHCKALKRLPELHKASLVTLRISNCPEMEFSKEDFEHLVLLESLRLYGLPKLTCFPEGITHSAATLRHLRFQSHRIYGAAAVDLPDWIGTTLTSLEVFEIDAPKNWNVLPQWLQHLTALKTLQIWRCDPELVKRWKNRDRQREDNNSFNMIAHVQHISLSWGIY